MSASESTVEKEYSVEARAHLGFSRWWLLVAAVLMMALASPYQYVWSALEGPFANEFDASVVALGAVFTGYVIVMALSQFPAGWWRDRHGPRWVAVSGGILAGGGYIGIAFATELYQLFVLYGIGSIGVGFVYTVSVNTALKWFPDKRGLTTGLGTMAFGAGGAIFIPFVRAYADGNGLQFVLLSMGSIIAIGIVIAAIVLRDPPLAFHRSVQPDSSETEADEPTVDTPTRLPGYRWRETVRTWQFWLMYLMFFFVSAAGLMITARVILYAENVGLAAITATVAATFLPIASGGGRLIVGWISDRFARETVMAISFTSCGIGTIGLVAFGSIGSDIGFILMVAIAVFFWSSQFALFPSLVGDYYGPEHSSSNYALLYSSKMWGGVFGGLGVGWLVTVLGWSIAFIIGGILALLAGIAALVLRPPESRNELESPT